MAPAFDPRGASGTQYATSSGRNGLETSKTRTPPLKNVPKMSVSETNDPGTGRFSCRLWAPYRPPRPANSPTGGIGHVAIGTGFVSSLTSTTHTSLGQSAPPTAVASSETIISCWAKSGRAGCVEAGDGGGEGDAPPHAGARQCAQ